MYEGRKEWVQEGGNLLRLRPIAMSPHSICMQPLNKPCGGAQTPGPRGHWGTIPLCALPAQAGATDGSVRGWITQFGAGAAFLFVC